MTKGQQAIRQLTGAMRDTTGNLPPLPGVFPDYPAPVMFTASDGVRELGTMRWGMPGPVKFGGAPVTNIRNTASPHWRRWLGPTKRGNTPIRNLFKAAGETLQRVKPALPISPISVIQFLPPKSVEFDLLMIGPASQVLPKDALGLVVKAKQIVLYYALLIFGCSAKYRQNDRSTVLSHVFSALIGLTLLLVAQPGAAQSIPGSEAYCKRTLTGPLFMKLLNKIIKHGDLTDVAFLQKTLGTKLSLSYVNATPNYQELEYDSDQMMGAPIHVDENVHRGEIKKGGENALLRLSSSSSMAPPFFVNCLKLTGADFASTFGGRFAYIPTLSPFLGTGSMWANTPGKNGSKMDITFTYKFAYAPPDHLRPTPQEALVESIVIIQNK